MLQTTNYNLKKIELTDSPPDITVINPNWDSIDAEMKSLRELNNNLVTDYIRSPGYGVTTGSANIYSLTLNPALAAYTAGVCVAVKINIANTGTATININGLGAKSIKDSKGNALTSGKLALNSVYTFRYDGTNFILQGEGGEYGTATAQDVLSGKTIGTDNGVIEGTIPSRGATTITPGTLNQVISVGQYLSGDQTILGDSDLISANIKAGVNIFGIAGNSNVVDTSAGTASASHILSAYKAYVDGVLLTGTMASNGAQSATLTTNGASKTIPAGYTTGGTVNANILNLVAGNIKSGVNVGGVVGTVVPAPDIGGISSSMTKIDGSVITGGSSTFLGINGANTIKTDLLIGLKLSGAVHSIIATDTIYFLRGTSSTVSNTVWTATTSTTGGGDNDSEYLIFNPKGASITITFTSGGSINVYPFF